MASLRAPAQRVSPMDLVRHDPGQLDRRVADLMLTARPIAPREGGIRLG